MGPIFGVVMAQGSQCKPGAVAWIEHYFDDCVYDTRDYVGFILGLCSIMCWVVAQMPQLLANYRNQRADALSPFFLAEWLLGDTCNLVGALLKGDQPETLVLTAQYFLCMDVVLLLQYMYYTSIVRRRERTYAIVRRHTLRRQHRSHSHRQSHSRHHHGTGEAEGGAIGEQQGHQTQHDAGPSGLSGPGGPAAAKVVGAALAGTVLVVRVPTVMHRSARGAGDALPGSSLRRILEANANKIVKESVGTALGYMSCCLYLTSRLSQIYKNHTRRSAEGLAVTMFFCAVAANLFYGSALLLRSRTPAQLLSSLPWLVGSLGTVGLDIVILCQSLTYGAAERKRRSDEEQPLLLGADDQGEGGLSGV